MHPGEPPRASRGFLEGQHGARMHPGSSDLGAEVSLGVQQESQDGPHCFSEEAIRGLGTALGTQGLQLSVLTLSFIDLGNVAVKVLCQGLVK